MDGASFGRYQLLGSLGEGGMGQVFRAYDTATNREVALKVLAPHVAQDATFEQRFRREAQVAARLSEPHIVPIHGYGEIDGRLYVDMRLIVGRDLASVLEESGAMNPVRAVGIIEQVADALDAAHSIDLVHRDIKPSNILLGRRDFVHLIDFGIAQDVNATRLTRTGAAIGTFAYMAPERLDMGQAGHSSDIYSLACVLYECLTGQLPFPGESMEQQIAGHLSKPPPRPSAVVPGVPQAFDEVIARGMAKSPGERYPTVIALADAARAALHRKPPEPTPHAMPTQWAPTQQAAAPWSGQPAPPWPATPGPPAHGYPPATAPQGPSAGGDPARLPGPSSDQQPRQMNFVAPGAAIAVSAALRILICILVVAHAPFYHNHYRLFEFFYLVLWLILAAGFGLVAKRCQATGRTLSIMAWVTCAAVVLGALPWALLIVAGTSMSVGKVTSPIAYSALIAFGVTAHRPFGWPWSIPASVAGLFGIATNIMELQFISENIRLVRRAIYGGWLPLTFLIPLLILGIAMAVTRWDRGSRPS